MRNVFTVIANKFTQTTSFFRKQIGLQEQKNRGTKKETARSKSGGSSSNSENVAIDNKGIDKKIIKGRSVHSLNRKTKFELKRKKNNKQSRRSRRINRLHRQFH